MKIGFIGIGVMGSSIVSNLLKDNHEVYVYSRRKESAQKVESEGAIWLDTIADLTKKADIIMTMVGYPSDVKSIYFDENMIIDNLTAGKICVDLTTSSPKLAKEIAAACIKKGATALDAPVSGGDLGAKNGTMTIMVGGTQETYNKMLPIFKVIGGQCVLQGEAGSGQQTKMCNQIALAANMMGAVELIVYARKVGLDPERVLQSVASGSAGSTAMNLYTARIFVDDYTPGFFIKHFVKDLKIAIDETKALDFKLPSLELACQMYEKLENDGLGDLGTQALIKYYQD